ncbi:hypothetical protein AB0E69_07260 [Kribbella sp. NPDC026611]|uniref:hypothetical protein n=1 Tax=Kribbella sp. NPDC026611 TaxID=3154911 RepID=UPI003410A675
MVDPYRISTTAERGPVVRSPRPRGSALRTALWAGLLISAAGNATTSSLGVNPLIGIGFGLVTLGFIAALVVHHRRAR